MSLVVDSFCIQCYLRRNSELVRPLGTEKQTTAFLKRLMQMYLDAPEHVSSPWFGPKVADLLEEMYGIPVDRFHDERIASNQFVLERLPQLREKANSAADPVLAGLQLAILGNYLDFSALQGKVDFSKLDDMLTKALEMELDKNTLRAFRDDLSKAKTLLYLTDNAGEIGFDRIFAEILAKAYPNLKITFCVRGDVAGNDATREDAAAVGIPFPVIDNGNRIAGTEMTQLGEDAKAAMASSDIILAKGMGNTETMLGCGYNVYYAFLVKCPRFQHIFQKEMFTPMLIHEGDLQIDGVWSKTHSKEVSEPQSAKEKS